MLSAPVNRIIPFSNVDGPNNRLALFLQTCPFRCLYCHNPETIQACIHCGACVQTCPVHALTMVDGKVVWDKQTCVNCDTCLNTCQHLSTPKITWMSVQDVLEQIKKVRLFIKGITVSGGECMNHAAFLTELFTEVQKLGLTCFIDSNGYHDFEDYPDLMKVTDAVMLDVKAYDPLFHQTLTNQDNATVIKNLHWLLEHKKMYEVRTVLLNQQEAQNENTVRHCAQIIDDRCRYKLIQYRPFGVRENALDAMGRGMLPGEEKERCANIAKEYMQNVIIV